MPNIVTRYNKVFIEYLGITTQYLNITSSCHCMCMSIYNVALLVLTCQLESEEFQISLQPSL